MFRRLGLIPGLTSPRCGWRSRRRTPDLDCQQRALAICRSTGDLYGEGRALNHLGMTYRALRRLKEALGCFSGPWRSAKSSATSGARGVLINLSMLPRPSIDSTRQIDCCQQSVAIAKRSGTAGVRVVRCSTPDLEEGYEALKNNT